MLFNWWLLQAWYFYFQTSNATGATCFPAEIHRPVSAPAGKPDSCPMFKFYWFWKDQQQHAFHLLILRYILKVLGEPHPVKCHQLKRELVRWQKQKWVAHIDPISKWQSQEEHLKVQKSQQVLLAAPSHLARTSFTSCVFNFCAT